MDKKSKTLRKIIVFLVWTVALLHGSHNVLMLHVFNTLTTDTGGTWLLLGKKENRHGNHYFAHCFSH